MMRAAVYKYMHRTRGSSNMYVLVIMLIIMVISYLLAGGLVPRIVKAPEDPIAVQVTIPRAQGSTNTLQLINLEVAPEQE